MRSTSLLALLSLLLFTPRAYAFTIESPIGDGCHERITTHAITTAAWPADVPSLPADDAHRRLVVAMPFTVPPEAVADPRLLALLIGVRSPDTEELALTDLDRLASLHGAHGDQHGHCLRESEDDGDAGNAAAIASCRAEILAQLDRALGPGDMIDGGSEPVTLTLAFEGSRTIEVPTYEYHLGRALHALQDSFPHTFRDASGRHVVAVHNWIDWVSRHDYDAARDGEHHVASRDECGDDDDAMGRAVQAELASTELLTAFADTSGGRAGRLARATTVLDEWLTLTPDCNEANAFCAAPDAIVKGGCDISAGTTPAAPALLTLLFFLALVLVRRRPHRLELLALVIATMLAAPVRAQEREGSEATAPVAVPAAPHFRAWALSASVGAAYDKGGLAFAIGGRYFANDALRFGLDVELAPWIEDPPFQVKLGTFDAIASVQWDWARTSWLRVGTRIAVGASVLLFDLPGASAGDVGLYVGGALIGVGFEVGHGIEVRVDPDIAVVMPHLVGLPLVYREYRLTISVAWRP